MSQRFYFYTPRNHFNSIQRPWKLRPRNTKSFPAVPYAFPFKTAWKQHFLTTTQVYSGLSFQGPFSRGVSSWVGWSKFPRHHKKKNLEILCLVLECNYTWKVSKTMLLCISSVNLYPSRGTQIWMRFRNFLFWNVCEPIKSLMQCRSEKMTILRRS